MTQRISPTEPRHTLHVASSAPRSTPPGAGSRFRAALGDAAGLVLSGVEAAASAVPGGAVVTAAIRGAVGGASPNSGNSDLGDVGGGRAALTDGSAGTAPAPGGAAAAAGTPGGELAGVGALLAQSADQNVQMLRLQEQLQAENRKYTALSNVLKARHETVKNAIGNIR
jgi:hypothetical protein